MADKRHGWFVIPGVQTGDRTIEEQRLGVERALARCRGKTVLDLGCAEGLLSLEFARAGALSVHAVDALGGHLEVAQQLCRRYRSISFEQRDLNEPLEALQLYDFVLALGVCHKLHQPELGIRFAADSARELVLVRMTRYNAGRICSKFHPENCCDVNEEMAAKGFRAEAIDAGPRSETVHYYRKA